MSKYAKPADRNVTIKYSVASKGYALMYAKIVKDYSHIYAKNE